MKDGEGRDIDFKNTVLIMTSNAGTDLIDKLFADPETAPDAAGLAEALRPELMKYFKPAFLGRVTLVPRIDDAQAVEITIPGGFQVTPRLAQALKIVPGVERVEEV